MIRTLLYLGAVLMVAIGIILLVVGALGHGHGINVEGIVLIIVGIVLGVFANYFGGARTGRTFF